MRCIARAPCPTSVEFLTWVHKSFYDEMPDEFRVIEHPDGTQEPIVPGQVSARTKIEKSRSRPHITG
ncbi:hypothetical protein GCM10011315_40530 [Roseovarius pacificus]|nr:hypothetical protein GCM10011315_40530 [Roseovarius pacificus]